MKLSEAEIQVLATLRKAELEEQTTDRASLEAQGDRYWIFLEDWSRAFSNLIEKGLLDGDDKAYRLTEAGHPLGDAYHRSPLDRTTNPADFRRPASHRVTETAARRKSRRSPSLASDPRSQSAPISDIRCRTRSGSPAVRTIGRASRSCSG